MKFMIRQWKPLEMSFLGLLALFIGWGLMEPLVLHTSQGKTVFPNTSVIQAP